jgi:hypothetical protein
MRQFVLHYHDCPPGFLRAPHWDLMLEAGDSLCTWALAELPCNWHMAQSRTAAIYPNCPSIATRHAVDAEKLGDHRSAYLDYEGPVRGERGRVVRIDRGTYIGDWELADEWQLEISGGLWRGKIVLQQTDATNWTLTCQQER